MTLVRPSRYSPEALPSRLRAAAAKKRRLSIVSGTSNALENFSGLPVLRDSVRAKSSARSSSRPARRSSTAARSAGVMRLQTPLRKAARAAATARSASAAEASATSAIGSPVAGSLTVRVADDGTSCPSISSAWACALSAMDIRTLQLGAPSPVQPGGAMDTAPRVIPECATKRMLTLADVLELPVVRRALPEVIAGADGLDCPVRWAHVIEMADPTDLLKGGELVLTTGIGAGARERDQARWVASVLEQGAAALAVELGTTWREHVPDAVVRGCAEHGVPLVAFRRQVRFIEITEAVHAAVLNSQFELLRRGEEIHRRFTELILHGRGVPEILAELAAAVGNPVVLEDAGHELVYYVSGGSGDDVALAAWADVHRAEDRGEAPEGVVMVDVRLMDSSWGRLLALAVDEPLDDFDRVATERAALAVAIDLLGQQHEEHLRARSRGAFLSDLADGRVEEADARRRAEALGFSGSGRGELLPLAASWRGSRARRGDELSWTRLSGELRAALSSTGFGVLLGPRDVDLLVLLSL